MNASDAIYSSTEREVEKAWNEFNICVKDKVSLEIGASTGGITHSLLNKRSKQMNSIEVGNEE